MEMNDSYSHVDDGIQFQPQIFDHSRYSPFHKRQRHQLHPQYEVVRKRFGPMF